MRRLSGMVAVRETAAKVPNLVIAAYASELTSSELETAALTPGFVDSLGDSLGSVLSDKNGRFELDLGDDTPHCLILAAFAPADSSGARAPCAPTADERLLFLTRTRGGTAHHIRLPRDQVEALDILGRASTAIKSAAPDAAGFVVAQNAARLQEERLAGERKEARKERQKLRQEAQKKVGVLTAIPKDRQAELKKPKRYSDKLIIGKKNLAKELPTAQRAVVTQGLKRMAGRRPSLSLQVDKADLRALGLRLVKGQLQGKANPAILSEIIRNRVGGVDLIRSGASSLGRDASALRAKYLSSGPVPVSSPTSSPSSSPIPRDIAPPEAETHGEPTACGEQLTTRTSDSGEGEAERPTVNRRVGLWQRILSR